MKICKLIQKSVLFEKNRVCLYFIAGVVAVPEEENIEPNCTIRSTVHLNIILLSTAYKWFEIYPLRFRS